MKKMFPVIAVAALILLSAIPDARAAATIEELQKQMDEMKMQLNSFDKPQAVQAVAPPAQGEAKVDGSIKAFPDKTRFGGYGELKYTSRRNNSNDKGGNNFDPHRIVLYVESPLSDWITFNSELEWEHGGVKDELNKDNELSGEAAVEQAFLDFKLSRQFNVKAGVMLVPLGAINLNHEPTNFNSGERPQLDQFLIPSTWSEMGAGIHGDLSDKASYQLYVMNGLDGSRFSAGKGIRNGRQNLNVDNNNGKALAGRLDLQPLANLRTNLSFYTGNSGKDTSAYTTVAAFDGSYSLGNLDLAGEYVFIYQDDPAALGISDIGHRMSGYWIEGGWHVMPQGMKKGKLANSDAILFARWSEFNTQQGGVVDPGTISGRYDRNYTTVGLHFKPTTTVSIKADYQFYGDHRSVGETPLDNDKFQLTLGFVF
ncbi:MAG: porin [Geobacteraceae bacterium GWC2_53_11]|nr:MAG: porin [Geobacteraceae bacterium GWC2_53_11]